MERGIWLDDKCKGKLGLLEQRVGGGHRIERRSNIFGGTVGCWRRCYTGVILAVDLLRLEHDKDSH